MYTFASSRENNFQLIQKSPNIKLLQELNTHYSTSIIKLKKRKMRLSLKQQSISRGYKERIIQFGEGNFLRAFVDWIVNDMNEKLGFNTSAVLVQPINNGLVDKINEQDGLYTLVLKGIKNGIASEDVKVMKSVSRGINPFADFKAYLALAEDPDMRFIVSNTTEAGIVFSEADRLEDQPAASFPGKLTQLLYHRFKHFAGDRSKGFILFPCELIDRNGDNLKKAVSQFIELWQLGADFAAWVAEANVFCNTLVDRIVPGYPRETAKEIEAKQGYEDQLIVEAEPFHLWVIEGPQWIKNEWPTEKAGLDVLFVDDMTPYRTRKVRILNGAHTTLTPVAYLYGIETVKEAVEHPVVGRFIEEALAEEIIPTLDLPKEELVSFAADVKERFLNPYVKHALMSISLNSISKYKARVLPSVLQYQKINGVLPSRLVYSLAATMVFYRGKRGEEPIAVNDDKYIMDLFASLWASQAAGTLSAHELAQKVLAEVSLWGMDLNTVEGLTDAVGRNVAEILEKGIVL